MKDDLSTAEGLALIDQIAEVGKPVLVFSGGEPLMRPDIFELAEHAKASGLLIALATNGTMIDRVLAGHIVQVGFDRVSVSLDGADADIHDRFRGLPGAFAKSMQGLRELKTAGVATQINCTVARHNQHQLGDVLKLGQYMGVVAVHYFLLVPVGCGEQIADDQMLSMQEVEDRLLEICTLEQDTPLQIKATCAPHYYRIIRQQMKTRGRAQPAQSTSLNGPHRTSPGNQHGSLHSITKGCLAGTDVCFVSHTGKVFPCGYLPISCGDVRNQSFGDIWRSSPVFDDLRDPGKLTGKCGLCEFKKVCGGCRARAFYEYGSYLAEEPCCAYEPKS